MQHVPCPTVTCAGVHQLREGRRDITTGKERMLCLANHFRGGEADDRVQSIQLSLDAKHVGLNPSNQLIQIKENLISKYFQCLLCVSCG